MSPSGWGGRRCDDHRLPPPQFASPDPGCIRKSFHEEARDVQSESTRAIHAAGGCVGVGEKAGPAERVALGLPHLRFVLSGGGGGGAGRSREAAPGPDDLALDGPPCCRGRAVGPLLQPPTQCGPAAPPQPRPAATHSPCFHSQSRRRPTWARCMLGIRPEGALQSDPRPRRPPGGGGSQVLAQSPGLDDGVATDRWAAGVRQGQVEGGRRWTESQTSARREGWVQAAGCSSGSR